MLMSRTKLFFILTFFFACHVYPQNKEVLKQQKINIEQEIQFIQKLIEQNSSNQEKSTAYIQVLDKQINNKEKLLETLKIEAAFLAGRINNIEENISSLEVEIDNQELYLKKLIEDYERMIMSSYKKRDNIDLWVLIFSSNSLSQAYKRTIYLKQNADFRKKQKKKTLNTKLRLLERKNKLLELKNNLKADIKLKKDLRDRELLEASTITETKKEQKNLIKKLIDSESEYRKKITEQQNKARELEAKIRRIIEEEIKSVRERNVNKGYMLTPEATKLSREFHNNKGKLPWPLSKGLIIRNFGKQNHDVFKGVETYNNGIDIATEQNSKVRAVFDGVVSRIFFIKGKGKSILINHGEYFTVYSGLKEVLVKQGEEVLLNETIGVVYTQEKENTTELHFEIWQGYNKKDPSKWLISGF